MKIERRYVFGIISAVIILAIYFIFWRDLKMLYFIIGLASIAFILPFVVTLILESGIEKEKNEMFLEFSRNIAESVKAGTPVSKSIINLKYKNYGSLTPNIQKLANQISLGISVKDALEIFAKDVNSRVVKRAVTLISEADKAGGEIEEILESVAKSTSETEELKKERMASIYNLVVQGYVIFFVFIAIVLVMQFKILPMISELQIEEAGFGFASTTTEEITKPLFYLLIIQGLFTGLVIGKLAEGSIKAGIKHSFAMATLSLLIYTGTKAFF